MTPYEIALKYKDTREIPGAKHNPLIVKWFGEVGHAWVKDDETAWCAAFVGAMLQEAGLPSTRQLNARSYLEWGEPVMEPKQGDIVVFSRGDPNGWQGHVGFFKKQIGDDIYVLGGNQSNAVNVSRYSVGKLLGCRRMKGLQTEPKPIEKKQLSPVDGPWGLIVSFFRSLFGR